MARGGVRIHCFKLIWMDSISMLMTSLSFSIRNMVVLNCGKIDKFINMVGVYH